MQAVAGARCFPPEGRRCPGGPWASAWPVGSCAGAAGNAQLRDGCDRWLNRPPAQRRRRPPRRQMSLSACFLAYTFFSPGNPEAPTQPPPPARSSGRAKCRRNFQKDLEERKGVLRGGGGGETPLCGLECPLAKGPGRSLGTAVGADDGPWPRTCVTHRGTNRKAVHLPGARPGFLQRR